MSVGLPPLTLIAARSPRGVIGRDGKLPWDLPEDRAYFRRQTMGHAVIMGRRTWDETGRPLDGRRNIVISRSGESSGSSSGREVVGSLEQALAAARTSDREPFVIGGAQIFRLALPIATCLLLTEVSLDVPGDTFFPPFDASAWRITDQQPGDRAVYVTYQRQPPSPDL